MCDRTNGRGAGLLLCCAWLVVFGTCAAAQGQPQPEPQRSLSYTELREGFASPPASAKLWCYWWWLNGNTTEETITHDLTEMSQKGFGGVLLVDANGSDQHGNADAPAGPAFGSAQWTALYVHALKVAAQVHLQVVLNITSGWNLGGPDVKPEQASKLLTWSRVQVTTSGFHGVLPAPPRKNDFYREIAVLAYPLAHGAALPGRGGDQRKPIRNLTEKSGSTELGLSMPRTEFLLTDNAEQPGEEDTDLKDVWNISAFVGRGGELNWRPPAPGAWEILRIGYTDSDARVSTSSDSWQGLAIDYLDRGAFDTYWMKDVAPLLEAAKPYLGTTLTGLATDSWELGGTNWTGRFAEEFRKRRGYDAVSYLPVVAGRIVGDRQASNAFLNDLRRTTGDLVTDHYDHFAERAREYGLYIQCESGGPHGAPMDALETFRSAGVPQTEYWAKSNEHRTRDDERYFTKEAASAADIYGKRLAAQEGFTSIGPQWSESLATDLKPSFDQAVTEGMNRLVWHEFTSSPASTGLPGNEYFAGTHINPKITWWNQGTAFFAYLNRSQFLLQQGHAVDDVLYFYGDEVPNFVRLKRDDPAGVLPGYDYDVTNEDALLHALRVENGRISTPAGNRYAVMVMPRAGRLGLASLEKIAAFVKQGGMLAGTKPVGAIGNLQQPASAEFGRLTEAMWGGCESGAHVYGAGKVFCGGGRAALEAAGARPDFEAGDTDVDFVHRRTAAADVYFIRNGTASAKDVHAKFRVSGRAPEIWDAITGAIATQAHYAVEDGRTQLTLHLEPYGSTFVIFAQPEHGRVVRVLKDGAEQDVEVRHNSTGWTMPNAAAGTYSLQLSDGRTVTLEVTGVAQRELAPKAWTIRFQPGRGAPTGANPLTAFRSWSESSNPRIRYFSGTATYRIETTLNAAQNEQVLLRLTDVREICSVRVNGTDAGTIWSMPYVIDVTRFVRPGINTIELDVTNLWPNRIIGDAQRAATERFTHTNIRKYTANSPLLPSGLIGPVFLETRSSASVQ